MKPQVSLVIDADDLLDNPEGVVRAYWREVGLEYTPEMLNWERGGGEEEGGGAGVQEVMLCWECGCNR